MSTAAMNHPRTSTSADPRQPTAAWQNPASPRGPMLPPIATYSRHRQLDRTTPGSPTTPVTPGGFSSTTSIVPWSAHDDEILLAARAQGHGWNQIQSRHFPAKTANACRKRYERLIAKRRGSEWDNERIDRITRRYFDMRERMWRPLAEAEGENWEDVEKLVSFLFFFSFKFNALKTGKEW